MSAEQRQSGLFGREREVAALWQQFELARGGHFRAVLLAGEPGLGESRLLRHQASLAEAHGANILRGGASEISGMPPYLPFLECLGGYIRQAPEASLRRQALAVAPILNSILPELTARLGPLPAG